MPLCVQRERERMGREGRERGDNMLLVTYPSCDPDTKCSSLIIPMQSIEALHKHEGEIRYQFENLRED